jgi:hypothetical protein
MKFDSIYLSVFSTIAYLAITIKSAIMLQSFQIMMYVFIFLYGSCFILNLMNLIKLTDVKRVNRTITLVILFNDFIVTIIALYIVFIIL